MSANSRRRKHERRVRRKQCDFWRARYNVWLNSWRGKAWRWLKGDTRWWETRDFTKEIVFQGEERRRG